MAQGISITKVNCENKLQLSHVKNENYNTIEKVIAFNDKKFSKAEMFIIDNDSYALNKNCKNEDWKMENRQIIEMSNDKMKTKFDEESEKDMVGEMCVIDNSIPSNIQIRSVLHNVDGIPNVVGEIGDVLLPKSTSSIILTNCNNCNCTNKFTKNFIKPHVNEKTLQTNMEKVNSIYSQGKIRRNIKMRRNPVRGTKKKFDDLFIRPRLLTTKKRGNNDIEHVNRVTDKKQTKVSNTPYMNTRSVTKKLYNIGANHQSPTVKDQIEWREWPIHGMHERPVYHPQVGLAVECLGNDFISLDGLSYQKVTESLNEKRMKTDCQSHGAITQSRGNRKNQYGSGRNIDESFENCMHDSLHSVLAYAAQIKRPQYKKLTSNYECLSKQNELPTCSADSNITFGIESSRLQLIKPPLNVKCIKNHAKLQRVLKCGSKNTLILLKTTDLSLQDENNCQKNAFNASTSKLIPERTSIEKNNEHCIFGETSNTNKLRPDNSNLDTNDTEGNSNMEINDKTAIILQPIIQNNYDNDSTKENWLHELISDTAVLYCTAIGTHQDNFVMYLNTLDAHQCIDWIKSGY